MDPLKAYLEQPCAAGFERLVRAYYPFVWQVALRVTSHQEDAADVCQDLFLKLFLEPPPSHAIESVRGFLAWRVLSRVEHLNRASERRRAREREAARRTLGETGSDAEGAEDLRKAVATLPEDLRVPVELHYFAGCRRREIAELLGLSEQAIGLRLEKALKLLKRRLGVVGALAAAPPVLQGAALPPPEDLLARLLRIPGAGPALAVGNASLTRGAWAGFGGLIMSGKKLVFLGAAVLLLLGGFLVTRDMTEESSRTPSLELASQRDVSLDGDGRRLPPPSPEPSPGALAGDGAEKEASPDPTKVRGRVVDAEGNPAPGAWVGLFESETRFDGDGASFVGFPPATRLPPGALDSRLEGGMLLDAETRSDRSGRFELDLPRGLQEIFLKALDPEELSRSRAGPLAPDGEEIVLRLEPLGVLSVRVLDAGTQVPVAGATVTLSTERPIAREDTDLTGRARFGRVPEETCNIEVVHAAYNNHARQRIEPPFPSAEVVLPMQDAAGGMRFEGHITDSLTGLPVRGALVGVNGEHKTLSDAEGRYAVAGPEWKELHFVSLRVQAEGYDWALMPSEVQKEKRESYRWDAALTRSRSLRCRVVKGDGRPVPDAKVALGDVQDSGFFRCYARSDEDGYCEFSGLSASKSFKVFAYHQAHGRAALDGIELGPGPERDVELVLERGTGEIAIHVSNPDGSPAAGAWVLLRDGLDRPPAGSRLTSGERFFTVTNAPALDVLAAERSRMGSLRLARADAAGRARFREVIEGLCTAQALDPAFPARVYRDAYSVSSLQHAAKENVPRSEAIEIEVSREDSPLACDLALRTPFTLEGKLLKDDASPAAGQHVILFVEQEKGESPQWVPWRVSTTGPDGGYRFHALEPERRYALGARRALRLPEWMKRDQGPSDRAQSFLSLKGANASPSAMDVFQAAPRDGGGSERAAVMPDLQLPWSGPREERRGDPVAPAPSSP